MDKIIFVFNKFYTSLIKDVKKNTSEDIKNTIRKHYKAIDKLSHEYIEFFIESFDNTFNADSSVLEEKHILKTIKIGDILPLIKEDDDKLVFWNYYYILATLALVFKEYKEVGDGNVDPVNILTESVLNILTKKQKGEDVTDDISIILHDDIQVMLTKIKSVVLESDTNEKSNPNPNPFSSVFKGMEDSKICNLAQEISNDIDVSNLKIDSPDDIMKLLDFSSSNNIMGDIIKKVSSKMHEKISNGELKQEDLFGEAMSMMGKMNMGGGGAGGAGGGGPADAFAGLASMMGGGGGLASMMGGLMNNPMMAEMMKAAKKGKVAPNTEAFKGASSRERLRKKLDERKNRPT